MCRLGTFVKQAICAPEVGQAAGGGDVPSGRCGEGKGLSRISADGPHKDGDYKESARSEWIGDPEKHVAYIIMMHHDAYIHYHDKGHSGSYLVMNVCVKQCD